MLCSKLRVALSQDAFPLLRSFSSWCTIDDPGAISGSNAAQVYNLGKHDHTNHKTDRTRVLCIIVRTHLPALVAFCDLLVIHGVLAGLDVLECVQSTANGHYQSKAKPFHAP
jgi:hypothetical protein